MPAFATSDVMVLADSPEAANALVPSWRRGQLLCKTVSEIGFDSNYQSSETLQVRPAPPNFWSDIFSAKPWFKRRGSVANPLDVDEVKQSSVSVEFLPLTCS